MFNFKKKVKNESKVIKNAITVVDKRDEKLAELYNEIDVYLQKIYTLNFAPNKKRILKKLEKSTTNMKNKFEEVFGGYKNIDTYDEFKNYLTVNNPKVIKPKILYDYLTFVNSVNIKHTIEKNVGFEFTRFSGESFKEYWNSRKLKEVADTRVEWANRTMELMVKVVPLFEYVDEEISWEWNDINASDIQNKFIELRLKEVKMIKGQI